MIPHRRLMIGLVALVGSCSTSSPAPKAQQQPSQAPALSYEQQVAAALSYVDSGNPARGGVIARDAAQLAPERPEAYYVLGRAAAMQEQLEDSAAAYTKAVELGASDRRVFVELSSVLDISGRYADAITVYETWLKDYPEDAEMLQQLGLTYLASGDAQKGAATLRQALTIHPNNIQIAQDTGYALLQAGQYEDARVVLGKVLKSQPSRHEAAGLYAQALVGQGKLQQAVEFLAGYATNERPPGAMRLLRARILSALGNQQQAWEDFDALLAAHPKDAGIKLAALGPVIVLGLDQKADALLQELEAAHSNSPLLKFRKLQLQAHQGDKTAVAAMAQMARDNPGSAALWRAVYDGARHTAQKKLQTEAKARLQKLGILH